MCICDLSASVFQASVVKRWLFQISAQKKRLPSWKLQKWTPSFRFVNDCRMLLQRIHCAHSPRTLGVTNSTVWVRGHFFSVLKMFSWAVTVLLRKPRWGCVVWKIGWLWAFHLNQKVHGWCVYLAKLLNSGLSVSSWCVSTTAELSGQFLFVFALMKFFLCKIGFSVVVVFGLVLFCWSFSLAKLVSAYKSLCVKISDKLTSILQRISMTIFHQ